MSDSDPSRRDGTTTGKLRFVTGILAGGQSRRMGRPKALLAHPAGGTYIEHVANVAARAVPPPEEIVILGSPPPVPPSLSRMKVLPDTEPDAGPLAGLLSLLRFADRRWALLLACDMPWLDTPVLDRLLERATPDADAVVFSESRQRNTGHTCCALYHPRIQAAVADALEQGDRSVQGLLARIRTTVLKPSPAEARQLANVNTPEEHRQLGDAGHGTARLDRER